MAKNYSSILSFVWTVNGHMILLPYLMLLALSPSHPTKRIRIWLHFPLIIQAELLEPAMKGTLNVLNSCAKFPFYQTNVKFSHYFHLKLYIKNKLIDRIRNKIQFKRNLICMLTTWEIWNSTVKILNVIR